MGPNWIENQIMQKVYLPRAGVFSFTAIFLFRKNGKTDTVILNIDKSTTSIFAERKNCG